MTEKEMQKTLEQVLQFRIPSYFVINRFLGLKSLYQKEIKFYVEKWIALSISSTSIFSFLLLLQFGRTPNSRAISILSTSSIPWGHGLLSAAWITVAFLTAGPPSLAFNLSISHCHQNKSDCVSPLCEILGFSQSSGLKIHISQYGK